MAELLPRLQVVRHSCGHERLQMVPSSWNTVDTPCEDCTDAKSRRDRVSQLQKLWLKLGQLYKAAGVRFYRSIDALPGFTHCDERVQTFLHQGFMQLGPNSAFGETAYAAKKELHVLQQLCDKQTTCKVTFGRSVLADIDCSITRVADSIRSCQRCLLIMRKATDLSRERGLQLHDHSSTAHRSDSWSLAKTWASYYISVFEAEVHEAGLTEDLLTSKVFDQPEKTMGVSHSHGGFDELDFGMLSITEGHVPAEPMCGDEFDLGMA